MAKHILLVDDDPDFTRAMGASLTLAGYEVSIATRFDAALGILESTKIDLLITDLVMPSSVNGVALARMASLRCPGLPVLYLTGFDLPGIENEALLGPILKKPVDDRRLIEMIDASLRSQGV